MIENFKGLYNTLMFYYSRLLLQNSAEDFLKNLPDRLLSTRIFPAICDISLPLYQHLSQSYPLPSLTKTQLISFKLISFHLQLDLFEILWPNFDACVSNVDLYFLFSVYQSKVVNAVHVHSFKSKSPKSLRRLKQTVCKKSIFE